MKSVSVFLAILLAFVLAVPAMAQTRTTPSGLSSGGVPGPKIYVVLPNGAVSLADLSGLVIDTSGPVPVLKVAATARSRIYVNTVSGNSLILTLPNVPLPDTLILHKNGVLWSESVDYTVSGDTVTFINGQALSPGDVVNARFQY